VTATTLHTGHQVRLLKGGADFFAALVGAIDASVHEVRLETYIFSFDASGERVAAALERAAIRGVAVFLVMDGVGTSTVPKQWAQRFDAAGVQWHLFSPLGQWGLLIPLGWRRLHRKLCVVDADLAFCGGINVLDDYFDPAYGQLESPRFDFAVLVQGPLVATAHSAMVQFWGRLQITRLLEKLQFENARQTWKEANLSPFRSKSIRSVPGLEGQFNVAAALVLRDNVRNRSRIEQAYRRAIGAARHDIIIANAYFVPGRKLRRALILAARRGVRVQLLLQGRYEYFMQFHAARPVYGALLAAGVEIHEYEPSFLHAKVAVIDAHSDKPWATVGSSNLDPLSLLLAREANVVVEDAAFAIDLRQRLVHAMQHAGRRMDPARYAGRPLRQRMLDRVAFGLMRLALWVTGNRY